MIYISADDYGLCETASSRIAHCISRGAINKVSAFPNLCPIDLNKISENARLSLHLNLVEGRCLADPSRIPLLADKDGNLKHSFIGLLKLSLLHPEKFSLQVREEIRAQVSFWKSVLPDGASFCVDGHQHTHMIPAVFNALLKVLEEDKITPDYIRIPCEPMMPFIKTPSLYLTYSPINIIKQWLLKILWQINKRHAKKYKIPTAVFMGILFSGKMDEKRVNKILPKYKRLAEKDGKDIEVLFHPGYMEQDKADIHYKNIVFKEFYLSKNRKTEFDSVMKISERSVL